MNLNHLLVTIALVSGYTINLCGYSYWIQNGTPDNLYVQLHTTRTTPIKDEKDKNLGKLIVPGGHADGSEKLPFDFKKLIFGSNPQMTENRAEIDLSKLAQAANSNNINFTIVKKFKDPKQIEGLAKEYKLPIEMVEELSRHMVEGSGNEMLQSANNQKTEEVMEYILPLIPEDTSAGSPFETFLELLKKMRDKKPFDETMNPPVPVLDYFRETIKVK